MIKRKIENKVVPSTLLDGSIVRNWDKEPSPTESLYGNELSTWGLVYAFRWYDQHISDEKGAKFADVDVDTFKRFRTTVWAFRLLERGFELPEKENTTYQINIALMRLYAATKIKEKADKPKVNVFEATKNIALGFMDDLEDILIKNVDLTRNWYEYFTKAGVKAGHVPHMIEELKNVKNNKNNIIKAGAGENKASYDRAKKALAVIATIEKDLTLINKNTRAKNSKPRKRKAIDPSKLRAGLKFLDKSDELKIVSINPEKILSAKELWVFDTKYRTLKFYAAEDHAEFKLSGSTLKFVNENLCKSKTLRKPETQLPEFMALTPSKAMKWLDGVKAKEGKPTPRINEFCVLLKVN